MSQPNMPGYPFESIIKFKAHFDKIYDVFFLLDDPTLSHQEVIWADEEKGIREYYDLDNDPSVVVKERFEDDLTSRIYKQIEACSHSLRYIATKSEPQKLKYEMEQHRAWLKTTLKSFEKLEQFQKYSNVLSLYDSLNNVIDEIIFDNEQIINQGGALESNESVEMAEVTTIIPKTVTLPASERSLYENSVKYPKSTRRIVIPERYREKGAERLNFKDFFEYLENAEFIEKGTYTALKEKIAQGYIEGKIIWLSSSFHLQYLVNKLASGKKGQPTKATPNDLQLIKRDRVWEDIEEIFFDKDNVRFKQGTVRKSKRKMTDKKKVNQLDVAINRLLSLENR